MRPTILTAALAAVLLAGCGGQREDRSGDSPAPAGQAGAALMTVEEFREAVSRNPGGPATPTKQEFYARFGKPTWVVTLHDAHLYYECADGVAEVRCSKPRFERQKQVYVFEVRQEG